METRARGRCKRLKYLGRGNTRVIINSFNIRLKVFICNSRNFSAKLCKWLVKVSKELADLV